jgi:F0F1-type ATP synthase membrane subunit b/b'
MIFCIAVDGIDSLFGIFENNLINWLVLVGLLIWLYTKYVPPLLKARQERIETALADAAQAKSESLSFLEAQQKRVANAEEETQNILSEARRIAEDMSVEMQAQTRKDIAALEHNMQMQLENQRRLAVIQLRAAAARAAIRLSAQRLAGTGAITDGMKSRLLGQFLEELEGSKN